MQPVRELFGVGAVSLMLASSAPEAGTVVVRSSPRTAVVHPNRVVIGAPFVAREAGVFPRPVDPLEVLAAGDGRHAARGVAIRLEPGVPRDDRVRRGAGDHPFVRLRSGPGRHWRYGARPHDRRIPDGLVSAPW